MVIKPLFFLSLLLFSFTSSNSFKTVEDERLVSYEVNLEEQDLQFFWKDDKGEIFRNHGNLKKWLASKNQKLQFAMNGGMYLQDRSPQGLYIQNGKELAKINLVEEAYGNFYLQPNGIFYITKGKKGVVSSTTSFQPSDDIEFATQSGPMLVIDDQIHSAYRQGSKNLHIRNGVSVLPNGHLLFAMSKAPINLYDFASYFKNKGCKNALYLDGAISKTYLPEKDWEQLDGNFGVIIGVVGK